MWEWHIDARFLDLGTTVELEWSASRPGRCVGHGRVDRILDRTGIRIPTPQSSIP
jgi:hypothetical protein